MALRTGVAVLLGVGALSHEVLIGLRQQNLAELEDLFWKVSTPGNPDYLKFRSVEELADLVAPSNEDLEAAKNWLVTLGAKPETVKVSPLRDAISASLPEQEKANLLVSKQPAGVEFVLHRNKQATEVKQQLQSSSRTDATGTYTVERIKKAYGIPTDLKATNAKTLQMVWGPGTFGYSESQLESFKSSQCPLLDTDKVKFDTKNHGHFGDNYMEGNLDTQMISSFGLGVQTLVSNTNTSSSTEEGEGFGQALLDFLTELPSRTTIPQVLSLSLGSLSAYSCEFLISAAVKAGQKEQDVRNYLQNQRQVCMFLSRDQVRRINTAFQLLGTRGVSLFGSSGDGGSHFSFQPFSGGAIADVLNKVSCEYAIPVFPTTSPYITSVGGTAWSGFLSKDPSKPVAWSGSGGGFSWEFAAPKHQADAVATYLKTTSGVPDAKSFNASGRAYPDISSIAVEGTSQSSPMMAGIFSLIIDHRLNAGLPPLGFLGPRLYKAMASSPGEAFESVTSGNTKTSCASGFPAAAAWDPVTGWGRPKWEGMLKQFGSDSEADVTIVV